MLKDHFKSQKVTPKSKGHSKGQKVTPKVKSSLQKSSHFLQYISGGPHNNDVGKWPILQIWQQIVKGKQFYTIEMLSLYRRYRKRSYWVGHLTDDVSVQTRIDYPV